MEWNTVAERSLDGWVMYQLIVFMLGFYGWQFVLTLRYVELPLLTGRLQFKWAFVPYILARFVLLGQLLALTLVLRNLQTLIHCGKVLRWLTIVSNVSVSSASTTLFVRTVTLWKDNRWVQGLLTLLNLGQWVMGFASALTRFVEDDVQCGSVSMTRVVLMFYTYTTTYDAIILGFTVAGLSLLGISHSSPVWMRLFNHGVSYFVITLTVNLVVLVFAALNLNAVMSVMFTVPAVVVSVICSSQAVIALLELSENRSACTEASPAPNASSGKANQLTTNIDLNAAVTQWSLDELGPRRSSQTAVERQDDVERPPALPSMDSLEITETPIDDDDATVFSGKRSSSPPHFDV